MKETPLLKTAVFSDIHIWENYPFRAWKLNRGLRDARNKKPDAFLSLGDVTDHGKEEHWKIVEKCLEKHRPCGEIILTLGNHDTWTPAPEGTPKEECTRFANDLYMKYRERISGSKYDGKVYFTHVVNGYSFISLASEGDGVGAYISDEQIAWLDAELKKATADGKPVFVACHQAVNQTHGLPATFGDKEYTEMTGGIGPQSDAVNAVLQKYKNVFFFSGHSHMGLCGRKTKYATFEKVGNVYSVNLPCYMFFNHDGLPFTGFGFMLYVYADRVELKARNFNFRYFAPLYSYSVPLNE